MATKTIEMRDTEGTVYRFRTDIITTIDGRTLEAVLEEIKAGIALDFDVLSASKGYTTVTNMTANGSTETITVTATGKKTAERITTLSGDASQVITRFYETNGTTIKESRTETQTMTGDTCRRVVT